MRPGRWAGYPLVVAGRGRVEALEIAVRIERRHAAGARRGDGLAVHVVGDVPGRKHSRHTGGGGLAIEPAAHGEVAGAHGDRKSTRLNSSHSQISYAVFCLKKKKT